MSLSLSGSLDFHLLNGGGMLRVSEMLAVLFDVPTLLQVLGARGATQGQVYSN